jgi:hypothetical protein
VTVKQELTAAGFVLQSEGQRPGADRFWLAFGKAKPRAAQSSETSLPGSDCPLRRAGIAPTKLKPFEEVKKYIQFLERPDRAKWQKPDEVVFSCDVLLHARIKAAWLTMIHDQMRGGSRLVLIDFKEGDLPEEPPESIKVPKAKTLRLCQEAGFQLQADHADLLPY